jgi:cytochrome bd-type quinol oxidase subunit 2
MEQYFLSKEGSKMMKRITKHVILPSLAPILIVGLFFTPKYVFGCANRGYMALAIAFVTLILAFVTVVKAIAEKRHDEIEKSSWWVLTALILLTPTILLLGPLG